jgi:Clathrin light chain
MTTEDFELINNEIQQADANTEDLADDLAGMSFNSSIPLETEKEVPEKIRLWREEMERKLVEKDQMEQEAKEALRISAEKEMNDFQERYNETMSKTKSLNRNNEKEFEASATSEEAKNMWESITSLCDFSTKGPKNAKDASRMRSIFLHMKSAPKVN